MPPIFQPLIGGSFDALASQQQGWAGFNRGVEEGNINRAAAAQEVQNRWLEQVARAQAVAQQRDLQTQLDAEAIARNQATIAQQQAEQRRQFNIGVGLDRERIKAENLRTAEMGKTAELNQALQTHAAMQKIDSAGQTLANSYLIAKNNADAATSALEKIQEQIDEAKKQEAAELEKPTKQRDTGKIQSAQNTQKSLTPSLHKAEAARLQANNALAALHNHAGFMVDTENEQIVHLDTGKKWSFKAALDKAKSAIASGPDEPSGGGSLGSYLETSTGTSAAPPMWAGFSPGTQTTTSPVAPVVAPPVATSTGTNPYRVGARYGNLRYKGGDPNLEMNWEPVQ